MTICLLDLYIHHVMSWMANIWSIMLIDILQVKHKIYDTNMNGMGTSDFLKSQFQHSPSMFTSQNKCKCDIIYISIIHIHNTNLIYNAVSLLTLPIM